MKVELTHFSFLTKFRGTIRGPMFDVGNLKASHSVNFTRKNKTTLGEQRLTAINVDRPDSRDRADITCIDESSDKVRFKKDSLPTSWLPSSDQNNMDG